MTRLADVITFVGFVFIVALATYMLVDVALDPAACFGSCS